jgi:hypothetical protein
MRRSLAKFCESETSNLTLSWADFTTTTPVFKFSVHTRRRSPVQHRGSISTRRPSPVTVFALDCLIIIDEIRIFLRRSWILAKADAIFQLSEGSIFHDRGPEREPQYDRTPGRTPAAD